MADTTRRAGDRTAADARAAGDRTAADARAAGDRAAADARADDAPDTTASGREPADREVWQDRLVGLRRELVGAAGRHRTPLALGLAASSLALVAGAAGNEQPSHTVAAVLDPLAEAASSPEPVWDLELSEHDRVDFFVEFLMGRNYDRTRLWLERLGRYGPFIENELRERGMPLDLIWLATIESGLDVNAYSRAHAAGMWQFIAETGRRYGLEVSPYVDERRDPIKSTSAALTYLQEMYQRFGSWYLAAAGYNTGENRVGRLMRETTGTERGSDQGYWLIWDRLPRETRDYVPLMLAMGHIGKQPAKHGFRNLSLQDPLRFEEVMVPGGTQIADVASAAGADADEMAELNARFVRGRTPPNRAMAVRVPVGSGNIVAASLPGATASGAPGP